MVALLWTRNRGRAGRRRHHNQLAIAWAAVTGRCLGFSPPDSAACRSCSRENVLVIGPSHPGITGPSAVRHPRVAVWNRQFQPTALQPPCRSGSVRSGVGDANHHRRPGVNVVGAATRRNVGPVAGSQSRRGHDWLTTRTGCRGACSRSANRCAVGSVTVGPRLALRGCSSHPNHFWQSR